MSKKPWSITYNAPVVLTFSILCIVIHIAGDSIKPLFVSHPNMQSPIAYFTLVSWVLGHGDWNHLFGNLTMILLLGPILEKEHKTSGIGLMIFVCALVGGCINSFILKDAVLGASGIVFMFILLASTANIRQKEIPLTFLAVAVLFLGKEIITGLQADNISQAGHLIGGVVGASFGFLKANSK